MALLDAATLDSPSPANQNSPEKSSNQNTDGQKPSSQKPELTVNGKPDIGSVSRRGATRDSYRNAFDKPVEKITPAKTEKTTTVKSVPLKEEPSYERKPKQKSTELTPEEVIICL